MTGNVAATTRQPPSILAKAFELLEAFNSHTRVMTLSELSRAAGLPKSTVHRLLGKLIGLGAVEHHQNGYRIGIAMIRLGATTPAAVLRNIAVIHLSRLHELTGVTVNLGILRGGEVMYLERMTAADTPPGLARIGNRLPAHCTALGKALLAHVEDEELGEICRGTLPALTPASITEPAVLRAQLEQVRSVGLAHERFEAQTDTICVGAPILVGTVATGAVSLSASGIAAFPLAHEAALRETAGVISNEVRAALTGRRAGWSLWEE